MQKELQDNSYFIGKSIALQQVLEMQLDQRTREHVEFLLEDARGEIRRISKENDELMKE